MKKTMKKLVLAKETVRSLVEATLHKVAGGATDYCLSNVGTCTYYNSCKLYCVEEPID